MGIMEDKSASEATRDDEISILYMVYGGKLDVRLWSGIPLAIYNTFADYKVKMDVIEVYPSRLERVFNKVKRICLKRNGDLTRSPTAINRRRSEIFKILKQGAHIYDAVFSIGSINIAAVKLDLNIPLFFYTDATMRIMRGYYPYFADWDKQTVEDAEKAEKQALDYVASSGGVAFYSSDWASSSAMADYHIPPEHVQTVGMGANYIDVPVTIDEIIKKRKNSMQECTRLLYNGVDWNRKGGEDFLSLIRWLTRWDIKVHADIVGATPNIPIDLDPYVKVYGFLNKDNAHEKQTLNELYEKAHFFVLPTHAECAGAVFCESSAYGLPCLSYDTGGVSTVIKEGENGFLFPLIRTNDMTKWGEKIMYLRQQPRQYSQLCHSAVQCYRKELNWKVVVGRMLNTIYERCGKNNLIATP